MTSMFEKVVKEAKRAGSKGEKSRPRKGVNGSDDNARSLEDSSGLFKVLSFASVEPSTMERCKILPAVEDKSAITAYNVLRTRVLQRMRSHNWRSLVVTGAGQGEGKTLTACNLAVTISKDVNQSVFLVDLDLQKSAVARYFGLSADAGIGDYLKGNAEIEDIVYAPQGLDRIAIIPNREPVGGSSELLASPRMRKLVRWLKEQGGAPLSIFDMPPVLACDDVLAFAPSIDAILMVASEGVSDRQSLAKALDMLGENNLLGVLLNQSRERVKASAYY